MAVNYLLTIQNGTSQFRFCKMLNRSENILAKSSLPVKKVIFFCLFFLIAGLANAQTSLKITRMKEKTWDSFYNRWHEWPTDWLSYNAGEEPILTLYKLDDTGVNFRVYVKAGNQTFSFDVTYAGFDANNSWSKYTTTNGDEIDITGATMSDLALNGWPTGTTVQIYMWVYSQNPYTALEME